MSSWTAALTIGLAATLAGPASSRADQFLPPVPVSLGMGAITVSTYGANDTAFMSNVTDNGLAVGALNFEYNTYSGTVRGGGFVGGAAFSGGFFAANNVALPAGDVMAWVQVVTTSRPNTRNVWSPQANVPYPDTRVQTSPNYGTTTVARLNGASNVTLPAPSIGFTDFPSRQPLATAVTTWSADLLLVIEDPRTNIATVLTGVRWGFGEKAVAPANATITDVTPLVPVAFDPALTTDLDNLNSYFDGTRHGTGTSTRWTFVTPKNISAANFRAVPEPASLLLIASGATLLAGIRRQRRAA
jgi:hypothetical protein